MIIELTNDFSIQTDSFSAAYLPADLENMKNVAVAYWQSKRNLPGAVVTKEGNRPKTLVYTDADGVVLTLTHNYVYDVNSDMCFLLNNETIKITK